MDRKRQAVFCIVEKITDMRGKKRFIIFYGFSIISSIIVIGDLLEAFWNLLGASVIGAQSFAVCS